MSAHHSSDNITTLYEGDQSKLYSGVYNHHTDIQSTESKNKVKTIWKITLYLTIITILEVSLGLFEYHSGSLNKTMLIVVFMLMTLLKAYLIVDTFMHLGDEVRSFVMVIIIPLVLLLWVIGSFLAEGDFWLKMNNTRAGSVKIEQIK